MTILPQAEIVPNSNTVTDYQDETRYGSVKLTRHGEINYRVVEVAADYSVRQNDRFIMANQSSGTITVTLPTGAKGKVFTVKALTANQVDITGSVNIDGVATKSLTSQYQSLSVVYDGSEWRVI